MNCEMDPTWRNFGYLIREHFQCTHCRAESTTLQLELTRPLELFGRPELREKKDLYRCYPQYAAIVMTLLY